ncbi:MAG: hypothetical protein BSOLF_0739 [Candidatus Carbobacillus altaicus]|uniref:DUF6385 domain-containing protein n=1 Tax=Candidatus Carbonibacillus altaicus TaxID=2163959 RepID=A0A2R6Y0G0_9BACL|nr:MAG: hypothetical protein BSOLF_0739 [Candidatus Carbobacillus altaicus]
MPNYSVFNTNPDQLQTVIFGTDGTGPKQITVDTNGQILVGGATITAGSIDVASTTITGGTIDAVSSATITGGTIDAVSSATIAGGTIDAVSSATIAGGTIDNLTSIAQKSFYEESTLNITTGDTLTTLPAVSTSIYGPSTFFVYNSGTNDALVEIQISANGTNWYTDIAATTVAAGAVNVFVPAVFLKYTQLAYQSATAGSPTTIDVYFNAQGT